MHEHEHEHSHPHEHGPVPAFESLEQAEALMSYMLDHNRHHAEELHEVGHKLAHTGKEEAAKLIHEAVDKFSAGNELLAKALEALKA
jgi:uncharacterized FlgJ-related protein